MIMEWQWVSMDGREWVSMDGREWISMDGREWKRDGSGLCIGLLLVLLLGFCYWVLNWPSNIIKLCPYSVHCFPFLFITYYPI